MTDSARRAHLRTARGIIAALDESTPSGALRAIASREGASGRLLGAIVPERMIDDEIAGRSLAEHLWDAAGVLPFLRIDRGLEADHAGVRLARHVPELDDLLAHARRRRFFGAATRSVTRSAAPSGVARLVARQVQIGEHAHAAGLIPLLELDVDAATHETVYVELARALGGMRADDPVVLAVPNPSADGVRVLREHPRVARVVSLPHD